MKLPHAHCVIALTLFTLAGCAVHPQPPARSDDDARIPPAATIQQQLNEPPAGQAQPMPTSDKRALFITWLDQQNRLYRVAAPLLSSNTELCPMHARHLLGMTAKTKFSFPEEFVSEAEEVLGLDERLRVMNVFAGGSAALAGVQEGDVLLAAGIEPMPEGPGAELAAASLIAAELQAHPSLDLVLLRGEQRLIVEVPLAPACAMNIDLGNSDAINSYADGQRIMVTRGMLDFVRSDDELAYVIAREMAHNVLMPAAREDMHAVIDRLRTLSADPAPAPHDIAIAPFTPEADAAADELALYLLARAGYRIEGTADFWDRLARACPPGIGTCHTALHPSTSDRLSVIGRVTQTILLKESIGLPLVPRERQEKAVATQ